MSETESWWLVYPDGQRLTFPNEGAARRVAQGRSKRHSGRWIALQQAPPHHLYGFDGGKLVETSASDVPAQPLVQPRVHRKRTPPAIEAPQVAVANHGSGGIGCLEVVIFCGVWIGCTVVFGGLGFMLGWMPAIVLAYLSPLVLLIGFVLAVLGALLMLAILGLS